MNIIHLKQALTAETLSTGEIKGVAYSGAPIKNHGPFKNLIIDLSTLTVAKGKTPIFRDHMPFQVAGHGSVKIAEDVKIEGRISDKNVYGKEIRDLAADGFEWEMSLGVFDGQLTEFENQTINGIELQSGVVLKNGIIREVSVVALGADRNTSAEVFEIKLDSNKGESTMKLTQEQWEKFACGCGGSKESTPEQLEANFSASKEEVDKAKAEIEILKAKIAEQQAIIDGAKEEVEMKARTEEISLAIKEKNLEFTAEVLATAAKSAQSKDMFLSMIAGMKAIDTKISQEFAAAVVVGGEKVVGNSDEAIILKAEQLVKEGKYETFLDAINALEVK